LALSKKAHRELGVIYEKILRNLKQMPQDYIFRTDMEKQTRERRSIVMQNDDMAVVEAKIDDGKMEDVLYRAKLELTLVECFVKYKPWESLMETAPKNQWTWPPQK
ncbi:putative NADH dehydrogenase [ubiquinone] 1 alpha subcomplex subunit 5, partial [Habropoda laboriosa]